MFLVRRSRDCCTAKSKSHHYTDEPKYKSCKNIFYNINQIRNVITIAISLSKATSSHTTYVPDVLDKKPSIREVHNFCFTKYIYKYKDNLKSGNSIFRLV